jgi:hypothetical protein
VIHLEETGGSVTFPNTSGAKYPVYTIKELFL